MTTHKVFVYGTLREPNTAATHVLEYHAMYDLGAFPYIIRSNDSYDEVKGNIIEVDDEGLAAVDKYEGVARGLYTRQKVYVFPIYQEGDHGSFEMGDEVECFIYVGTSALHPQQIESGDWYNKD